MENSLLSSKQVLFLSTEKELRTYMHPLRQKILRTLKLYPDGMTAKQIADTLSIAPSSAGHHLSELEKIGVAVLARTENIHGFTAKIYQAANVVVSLSQADTDAADAKEIVIRHGVEQVLNGYFETVRRQPSGVSEDSGFSPEAFFGVCYFTREEAEQLENLIREYLIAHSQPKQGSIAYELALIAHKPGETL